LSTTYVTLGEFSRHGIIKLVCERCKKILDYKVPIAVDQRGVAKKTGFAITDTRLEYYGYCRECRKDKEIRDVGKEG
jgi:Fe2+ or Zn2+ uptake regulation protein